MPISTADKALIDTLKKAQHSSDPTKTLSILKKFLTITDVSFIVGTEAQKVVDECCSNDNPEVKAKAFAVTSIWKSVVKKDNAKSAKASKSKRAREEGVSEDDEDKPESPFKKKPAPVKEEGGGLSKGVLTVPRAGSVKVLPERVRVLYGSIEVGGGVPAGKSLLYWMSRDQRVQDNWALLYAQQVAMEAGAPLAVCFNLEDQPDGIAGKRQYSFMLKGLGEVEEELTALNIPMFLLRGPPSVTVPKLVGEGKVGLVIVDFCPLREGRAWKDKVGAAVSEGGVSMHEVDAHNVVPCWVASDKQEVMARTIRPKITKLLPKFHTAFPALPKQDKARVWPGSAAVKIDWDAALRSLKLDDAVPEVDWAVPGYRGGMANLEKFLEERLKKFSTHRNDPNVDACSDMSVWTHFGQVSAARCALEAKALSKKYGDSVASFVEEGVVRRELSDNLCFYNPHYDSLEGCAKWARDSLELHATDKREHVYTREQLEVGKTHDNLWNAAQLQLVHHGKMHGFLRMYWAKKILEWTATPTQALADSIYFNDRYSLDGRDPNGFVGCMWSIGGIHDMGWKERPVFGKIRYMNYAGCTRKFRVPDFVLKTQNYVSNLKKKK